jgi:hypothetical protein
MKRQFGFTGLGGVNATPAGLSVPGGSPPPPPPPPAPTFVSSTAYVTAAANAANWTPFSALDLSNCAMAVFVVAVDGGTGNVTTASSGWLGIGTVMAGVIVKSNIFYKVGPTASETLLIDFDDTDATTEQGSGILIRLNGANSIITGSTSNGIGSTNADPPSKDAGAVRNHFWIAAAAWDGIITASAAPSTYTNLATQAASGASGASSAIATKSIDSSQVEDPGAFTSTTEQWIAWTIATYQT